MLRWIVCAIAIDNGRDFKPVCVTLLENASRLHRCLILFDNITKLYSIMTFNASDLILSSSGIMVTKASAGSCKLCGARGRTLGSGGRTLPTAGLIAQSGPVRSSPCETVAISRVNAQSLLGYLKTFGFASFHMACKSTHDCVMHFQHR